MSTLDGYGENHLVAALLARLPAGVRHGSDVLTGAGDDCAVIEPREKGGKLQLLKTDCVIEGVHYARETPPEKVGWKALCRPLSDIAAMGGSPRHALITLALPRTATVAYAEGIYDGLGRAAERYGVCIVGGETARSTSAGFVSVALTGEVPRKSMVTRAGGRPGDPIYVTGTLGGSFASGKHLDFLPRLAEGGWLAAGFAVTAMMDLSDGLGRDLVRLAAASGTGYHIDPSKLPCNVGCSVEQAFNDGEDYELLFTVEPSVSELLEKCWRETWTGIALTCIGTLAIAGHRTGMGTEGGFDHFNATV